MIWCQSKLLLSRTVLYFKHDIDRVATKEKGLHLVEKNTHARSDLVQAKH